MQKGVMQTWIMPHSPAIVIITRDLLKLGSPKLNQRFTIPWLRSLLFGGQPTLIFKVKFNLKCKNLAHFELVHIITHNPFKVWSSNFDHRYKIPFFISLSFWGAIDRDLQCQILPKSQIFWFHHYWKYITTLQPPEPWVPRRLHMPDCFMVSILCMYLYT